MVAPLPPLMVYALTRVALRDLEVLVESYDKALEIEEAERAEHPEHLCMTEAVIKQAPRMGDAIYEFLMAAGVGIPSSICEPLQEAAHEFISAASFASATNPDCPSPYPPAQKAHEKLHEAFDLLVEREKRLLAALPGKLGS